MIVTQMIRKTFPAVRRQLNHYRRRLIGVDSPLARQGLASIRDKEFHCLGGSVYAFLAKEKQREDVLQFIVAFQTISDYLDNLCDRFGIHSEQVFRQLHQSMLDSLDSSGEYGDYYGSFPCQDDSGYLYLLVDQCREALERLPHIPQRRDSLFALTKLYIDLQSYKHMERGAGEERLAALYQEKQDTAPNLYWWEFAAACGSTLGVFALVAGGDATLDKEYMPWVQGIHILLDYYIDQAEDEEHQDMNFVAYYKEGDEIERLLWFYRQAKRAVSNLSRAKFHSLVVDGLMALYLSDSKARGQELAGTTARLMSKTSYRARMLERMARYLRSRKVI